MQTLPPRAHPDHLKKQAKELLRLYRNGDSQALARFIAALPAAAHRSPAEVIALQLRLHDAQSCIAREYGFNSWADLIAVVEARAVAQQTPSTLTRRWLDLAYGGDVTGNYDAARPRVAAQLLDDHPELVFADVWVALAAGHVEAVRRAVDAEPGWINRAGGPLALPPLVAVTHSRLGQIPQYAARLRDCVRVLLDAGADPDQSIYNRFPPASLASPDESGPLSALYGAAGVNRDPALTAMLLAAGANPNDGESLYHSLENPACTRLLLDGGAQVSGTNALRRALDMPDPSALEWLLAYGGDPNEPAGAGPTQSWGAPLLRAIAVRCPVGHIDALLKAGADPHAQTAAGVSAYRLAMRTGLTDVAQRLRAAGAQDALSDADRFVAACARADAQEARRIQAQHPELPRSLAAESGDPLRLLPDAAAWGSDDAVRLMVELGWPIEARGGDWDASALNHAVFRGDAGLTAFLLAHGANWREAHGYGGDALGTLSWASVNEPTGFDQPDWPACARALRAHGLPAIERDPAQPGRVFIEGRAMRFSEEVTEALLSGGPASAAQ
ncbi:ankyrin repeat protein [Paraburkholderia bannensis]|uniref:Ankyrin repeat protein n=1 Tax=Paraburkholderia bannensis TaxID=765414 RepID=A0A7W9U1B5_9BURK|nr:MULTISPECIES: ankyrin repeat domain-containing protein [Paraburkholderia]MBB3260035.1 ankyrin repeat protein [Paraburkholderia sp. WP4_3_2]MBB6105241.1 ankyrin repeat protein [Paraburkholderia bannensis]